MGRKRVFILGVALFTVASGLCAIAESVGELVAFRVLQGIGAAVLVPASLGLVVEAFPAERRAHGVNLWGGGGGRPGRRDSRRSSDQDAERASPAPPRRVAGGRKMLAGRSRCPIRFPATTRL